MNNSKISKYQHKNVSTWIHNKNSSDNVKKESMIICEEQTNYNLIIYN